ncbi:MAG: hypothetical protein AAGI27_08770 [Pseudomonadota bacterium]
MRHSRFTDYGQAVVKPIAKIPSDVTQDLFSEWRGPKRGTANPENMSNPVWRWLVDTRLPAYTANKAMNGPPSVEAGPVWCFDRFGQSKTTLPDGRTVLIGGEHEDYYDSDFYIYNDVVVRSESGDVDIYGYPDDIFPPTDGHTATLLEDSILLIGSLSYPEYRLDGYTQVMRLDLETFVFSQVETTGQGPGWIGNHTAEFEDQGDWIRVSGGSVSAYDGTWYLENIDEWRLNIRTWTWERLTAKNWCRFAILREDNAMMHLSSLRHLLWSRDVRWKNFDDEYAAMTQKLGGEPRLDEIATLYHPELADVVFPEDEDEDEYRTYRIRLGDVVVRYVESSFDIRVTVEGTLPGRTVEKLKSDLIQRIARLERTSIECRDIPSL